MYDPVKIYGRSPRRLDPDIPSLSDPIWLKITHFDLKGHSLTPINFVKNVKNVAGTQLTGGWTLTRNINLQLVILNLWRNWEQNVIRWSPVK